MKLTLNHNGVMFAYEGKGGLVQIPEGIKYISRDAFFDAQDEEITALQLPSTFLGFPPEDFADPEGLFSKEYDDKLYEDELAIADCDSVARSGGTTNTQGAVRVHKASFAKNKASSYVWRKRSKRFVNLPDDFDSYIEALPLLALERYIVDKNNPVYCDKDGVLFSKDGSNLLSIPNDYKGQVVIDEKVRAISKIVCPYRRKEINIYLRVETLPMTWFCMLEDRFNCNIVIYSNDLKSVIELEQCDEGIFVGDEKLFAHKHKDDDLDFFRMFFDYDDDFFGEAYEEEEQDPFGYKLFNIGSMILCLPNLDPDELYGQLMVGACIGYIYNSDRYSEEKISDYKDYLEAHNDYIYSFALEHNLSLVINYYEKQWQDWRLEDHINSSASVDSDDWQLTESDIKKCILYGSTKELKKALKVEKILHFRQENTIAIACRYGGLDVLKALSTNKSYYDKTENIKFSWFAFFAQTTCILLFVLPPKKLNLSLIEHPVYDNDGEYQGCKPVSESERVETLKFLLKKNCIPTERKEVLCFYAFMFGSLQIAQTLIDDHADMDAFISRLTLKRERESFYEHVNEAIKFSPQNFIAFAKSIHDKGSKLHITEKIYLYPLIDKPEFLKEIIGICKIEVPLLKRLVRNIVLENKVDALNAVLTSGRAFTAPVLKSFMEMATDADKPEMIAAILNYQGSKKTKSKKLSNKIKSSLNL